MDKEFRPETEVTAVLDEHRVLALSVAVALVVGVQRRLDYTREKVGCDPAAVRCELVKFMDRFIVGSGAVQLIEWDVTLDLPTPHVQVRAQPHGSVTAYDLRAPLDAVDWITRVTFRKATAGGVVGPWRPFPLADSVWVDFTAN